MVASGALRRPLGGPLGSPMGGPMDGPMGALMGAGWILAFGHCSLWFLGGRHVTSYIRYGQETYNRGHDHSVQHSIEAP